MTLDRLAARAPITPDMVACAYGTPLNDIRLGLVRDDERAAFMAIWAMLAYEWAEAMVREAQERTKKK